MECNISNDNKYLQNEFSQIGHIFHGCCLQNWDYIVHAFLMFKNNYDIVKHYTKIFFTFLQQCVSKVVDHIGPGKTSRHITTVDSVL